MRKFIGGNGPGGCRVSNEELLYTIVGRVEGDRQAIFKPWGNLLIGFAGLARLDFKQGDFAQGGAGISLLAVHVRRREGSS